MIICDTGSGNTCRNDVNIARQMVLELAQLNIPGLVIKWQLFKNAGDNVPLAHEVFDAAFRYAQMFNIGTTASVFDKESLDFLMTYNVPFVKIANNKESKKLINDIPINILNNTATPAIISTDDENFKCKRKFETENTETIIPTNIIYCVSKYPATMKEYESKFGDKLKEGISDHTVNFDMFEKYQPKIYEFHFKLEDSVGPDAGDFARSPAQIKEWLTPKKIDLEEVLRTAQ